MLDTPGLDECNKLLFKQKDQVRGFKPGRSRRIFKGDKNPQHAFLLEGSKIIGPMSQIWGM
jgi:hypothetical protein